jgi:hypothetical protein
VESDSKVVDLFGREFGGELKSEDEVVGLPFDVQLEGHILDPGDLDLFELISNKAGKRYLHYQASSLALKRLF